MLLAGYSGYGLYLAVQQETLLLHWFLSLYMIGFATVAGLSLQEALQQHRSARQRQSATQAQ